MSPLVRIVLTGIFAGCVVFCGVRGAVRSMVRSYCFPAEPEHPAPFRLEVRVSGSGDQASAAAFKVEADGDVFLAREAGKVVAEEWQPDWQESKRGRISYVRRVWLVRIIRWYGYFDLPNHVSGDDPGVGEQVWDVYAAGERHVVRVSHAQVPVLDQLAPVVAAFVLQAEAEQISRQVSQDLTSRWIREWRQEPAESEGRSEPLAGR
jgi:hypothetical protein